MKNFVLRSATSGDLVHADPADFGMVLRIVDSDYHVEPRPDFGEPSYLQLRALLVDSPLGPAQPLPPTSATAAYAVDFQTSDWTYSEADSLPPRMIYEGDFPRIFHVTVNGHFESTTPDGSAHIPVLNLYKNTTLVHHTHASVIIDLEPVLESSCSTTTLVRMQQGDYLTMQYGDEDLTDPSNVETTLYMVVFPLTAIAP